ncbi:MAG TPA: HNH endonuclease, partial [Anaerolineae bacterium]|nr:HNH endonuclease [Anaerolineae bacterium]
MQVLLLNATYEPLSIVSVRRAAVLVLQHKAEIVEATEAWLRAQSMALPMPAVIRLVYYVRVPRYLPWPLSRRTVLARDNYTCQYCGAQPGKTRLTLDHVIPRVRGGETTWENLVTACVSCNRRKGARTPEEAGMRLLRRPTRPRYLALALLNDFSS